MPAVPLPPTLAPAPKPPPGCVRRLAAALAAPCLALGLALTSAPAVPQPTPAGPPTAEVRAELERGVAAYEAGRVAEARATFEKLSAAGVPAAHYNLAMMHLNGHIPGGVAPALALLERAARGGFVTAMVQLGQLHEDGTATGTRDLAAAHRWYLLAAAAGSVEAQVAAGTAYYLGRGTARDMEAAAYWYREAAKGGDVGAMYLIASMYEAGLGVPCDLRLALYWYRLAADAGDAAAAAKAREVEDKVARPGC